MGPAPPCMKLAPVCTFLLAATPVISKVMGPWLTLQSCFTAAPEVASSPKSACREKKSDVHNAPKLLAACLQKCRCVDELRTSN